MTLWSENAAAGTTHPAHNNEYYCTSSPTVKNPFGNVKKATFALLRPSLRDKTVFDFRAHFCHSAPMETHAFGFRLRANAPEGQKRFPISRRREWRQRSGARRAKRLRSSQSDLRDQRGPCQFKMTRKPTRQPPSFHAARPSPQAELAFEYARARKSGGPTGSTGSAMRSTNEPHRE